MAVARILFLEFRDMKKFYAWKELKNRFYAWKEEVKNRFYAWGEIRWP